MICLLFFAEPCLHARIHAEGLRSTFVLLFGAALKHEAPTSGPIAARSNHVYLLSTLEALYLSHNSCASLNRL